MSKKIINQTNQTNLYILGHKIACNLQILGDFDKISIESFKKKLTDYLRVYLNNSIKLYSNENNKNKCFNEKSKICLLFILNRFMYEIYQYEDNEIENDEDFCNITLNDNEIIDKNSSAKILYLIIPTVKRYYNEMDIIDDEDTSIDFRNELKNKFENNFTNKKLLNISISYIINYFKIISYNLAIITLKEKKKIDYLHIELILKNISIGNYNWLVTENYNFNGNVFNKLSNKLSNNLNNKLNNKSNNKLLIIKIIKMHIENMDTVCKLLDAKSIEEQKNIQNEYKFNEEKQSRQSSQTNQNDKIRQTKQNGKSNQNIQNIQSSQNNKKHIQTNKIINNEYNDYNNNDYNNNDDEYDIDDEKKIVNKTKTINKKILISRTSSKSSSRNSSKSSSRNSSKCDSCNYNNYIDNANYDNQNEQDDQNDNNYDQNDNNYDQDNDNNYEEEIKTKTNIRSVKKINKIN